MDIQADQHCARLCLVAPRLHRQRLQRRLGTRLKVHLLSS
jgi:hypothetical protein